MGSGEKASWNWRTSCVRSNITNRRREFKKGFWSFKWRNGLSSPLPLHKDRSQQYPFSNGRGPGRSMALFVLDWFQHCQVLVLKNGKLFQTHEPIMGPLPNCRLQLMPKHADLVAHPCLPSVPEGRTCWWKRWIDHGLIVFHSWTLLVPSVSCETGVTSLCLLMIAGHVGKIPDITILFLKEFDAWAAQALHRSDTGKMGTQSLENFGWCHWNIMMDSICSLFSHWWNPWQGFSKLRVCCLSAQICFGRNLYNTWLQQHFLDDTVNPPHAWTLNSN